MAKPSHTDLCFTTVLFLFSFFFFCHVALFNVAFVVGCPEKSDQMTKDLETMPHEELHKLKRCKGKAISNYLKGSHVEERLDIFCLETMGEN